jgi:3-phosphoshikimate 1-carboxyvinyltransferase
MRIQATSSPLKGAVQLPASKSISHRVLMIQAMCKQEIHLDNLSEAHDTVILKNLLERIKKTTEDSTLDVEDAGTPFRFLTAYASTQHGRNFVLTGSKRLCERPVRDLVEALQSIGADIEYIDKDGFAPLLIKGKKLQGGSIQITGDVSSQFISALCLIAPSLKNGLHIDILHQKVSSSYIEMTLAIMREFGIQCTKTSHQINIPQQEYTATKYTIENDWSSATFFYSMAMIADEAEITINGLLQKSFQGDSMIQHIAKQFGVETIYDDHNLIIRKNHTTPISTSEVINLISHPDLAVPFIVACAIKYPSIQLTGIQHLELKESKRITALQNELKKINRALIYSDGILTCQKIAETNQSNEIEFNTYNDHRIAMALSMLALADYTITLDNATCVEKSFPFFFTQLQQVGIKCITM